MRKDRSNRRCGIVVLLSAAAMAILNSGVARAATNEDWVEKANEVHKRFTGQKGTFAHFGDSITITMAFWTPLLYERKNMPPEMRRAYALVKDYMREECWRDWKGPQYGNQGSMTIRWAQEHVDEWLERLNPEVALIMFGSNDVGGMDMDEYTSRTRTVVKRCLDNGTIVILSTMPPRHGRFEKSEAFAEAARSIAREFDLPLTDYHAEILKRRPEDWDGAMEKFAEYSGYDVPTLISRDGVHPSHPKAFRDDYSKEALRKCGFSLRNYLTLKKYAEVIEKVGLAPPQMITKFMRGDEGAAIIDLPEQPWFPKAPALPAPDGESIRVSSVEELFEAAEQVKPGGTIIVADGHYMMPRYFAIRTDNVTLRGESGNRAAVVLDGTDSRHGELVGITNCSGVTIADLTIQNIQFNGFKINSNRNVQNLSIYNCVIHNIWQRGVKGVAVPEENREEMRPRNCRIEYCLFYNDRPKQFSDDSRDTAENFNGNYVGGIDAMYPTDWTIADNVFIGIKGRTGEARGAVFLWHDARDCVVERNIIIDCDSGICLGNSSRGQGTRIHCNGCVVRNNFLTRVPENGILADYTQNCRILNNSVHDPESRLQRLIRIVHDNEGLVVANNLLSGPPLRLETDDTVDRRNNIERAMGDLFVNVERGNLHLRAAAEAVVDQGVPLREVTQDVDRQKRLGTPDIGADEWGPN